MSRLSVLPALGFVLAAAVQPAASQVPETTAYRDWQVVRDGDGRCIASTTVGLREADSGLVTVSLMRAGQGDAAALMSARVPLGAALDQPLAYTWRSGPTAQGLEWQSCDSDTCLALAPLDADELERLKRGRRVFFAFRPLPGARPLIVPVSLLGLTRAWAEVQDCR